MCQPPNLWIHTQAAYETFWEASRRGHVDVVRTMAKGAGIQSCPHIATSKKRLGPDSTSPLLEAVKARSYETVKELLDLGAPVDSCNDRRVTPVMVAAGNGDTEILELLLTKNPDVIGRSDKKPLQRAIDAGHKEAEMILHRYIAEHRSCA
ncbi:ankyrin repeat-containing domain protein [Podospora fimiseda]|uniref:Ankyrin repeat-containing domain protein n=1 Tax=Podospora fimiseda TaxID=252190 RepID=A0AAN7BWP3_9PEZI|nr:ankyrin repeat-containing domain protein [Podospora fimiseda]